MSYGVCCFGYWLAQRIIASAICRCACVSVMPTPTKHGAVGLCCDTIRIASICALLVVSTAPEVMHNHAVSCPRWSASRYWVPSL